MLSPKSRKKKANKESQQKGQLADRGAYIFATECQQKNVSSTNVMKPIVMFGLYNDFVFQGGSN